jgi:hypothetical protein
MEWGMKEYVGFYWASTLESLRYSWKMLLATFVGMLLIVGGSTIVSESSGVSVRVLLNDPAHTVKMPFYLGMLSNLGVMLWASAAACCFMGWAIARKKSQKAPFLLASGIFTAWLALDDLWLFHESIFPDYLHIGEGYVYLIYFILAGAYLLYFMKDILSTRRFVILAVALSVFAISIVIDKMVAISELETLAEDGLKLFAVAFWLVYYSNTAVDIVKEAV